MRRLLFSIAWRLFPSARCNLRYRPGLRIPVRRRDDFAEFQEIFLQEAYAPFAVHLSSVRSWIDIGGGSGYFSLYVLGLVGVRSDFRSLLVECNSRACRTAKEIGILNELGNRFQILRAFAGQDGTKAPDGSRCVGLGRLLDERFSGQADLLKMDIEGGERAIFETETSALLRFRHGIVEWHQPAWSGRQMQAWLRANGLTPLTVVGGPTGSFVHGEEAWEQPLGVVMWQNPKSTATVA